MQLASSARTYRRALDLYLVLIGVVTVIYGVLIARISRSWPVADWLINYEGGFVRRGLAGEAIFLVHRLLHVSPVLLVIVVNLALYAVLLLAVRSLAVRSTWSLWVLAVLFSPATLSFHVLDPTSGFRKESLYMAAFALFVVLLRDERLSAAGTAVYVAVAVVVAVLTHESLICFAPYYFAALLVAGRSFSQAVRQCAGGFLLGLVAAYCSAKYVGNLHTAIAICNSLGYTLGPQGSEICSGGAIGYLGFTPAMARQQTLAAFAPGHYWTLYPVVTLLAMAPLAAGSLALARAGHARALRVVWGVAAVSFVGSLILFILATDWGRWIYIHVISVAVLLLYLDGLAGAKSVKQRVTGPRRLLVTVGLVAYATLWTLPHVPPLTPRFGYVGLMRYVMEYRGLHTPPPTGPGTIAPISK